MSHIQTRWHVHKLKHAHKLLRNVQTQNLKNTRYFFQSLIVNVCPVHQVVMPSCWWCCVCLPHSASSQSLCSVWDSAPGPGRSRRQHPVEGLTPSKISSEVEKDVLLSNCSSNAGQMFRGAHLQVSYSDNYSNCIIVTVFLTFKKNNKPKDIALKYDNNFLHLNFSQYAHL